MSMNPEHKKVWVKALRSGLFRQGKGHLAYQSRGKYYYCCLGVARECIDGLDKAYEQELLGPKGLEILDIPDSAQRILAGLNDGEGLADGGSDLTARRHTFDEIADHIEKRL